MNLNGTDLTWDGMFNKSKRSILKEIFNLTIPIILLQISQIVHRILDFGFIARLSPDAVIAGSVSSSWLGLALIFSTIGQIGGQIGVSQLIGKGDKLAAREYAKNTIFISVILGIILGIITIIFSELWVYLFAPREFDYAVIHLRIIGFTFPMIFITYAITGIHYGLGNSKAPFILIGIGLIFNFLITQIFISAFGWGYIGIAVATAISHIITGLLLLFSLKHQQVFQFDDFKFKEFFSIDGKTIGRLLMWGLPIAGDRFIQAILSWRILSIYIFAVVANSIGQNIMLWFWVIGGSYVIAFRIFAAQNYGANNFKRLRKGYLASLIAMILWGTGIGLIMFFAGGTIFEMFTTNPEVIEQGVSYLRIFAVMHIAQCIGELSASAFEGKGQTWKPMLISIIFNLVAYFLSRAALEMHQIWLGIAFANVVKYIVVTAWYFIHTKKFEQKEVTA